MIKIKIKVTFRRDAGNENRKTMREKRQPF
jgi:hypothetical protein